MVLFSLALDHAQQFQLAHVSETIHNTVAPHLVIILPMMVVLCNPNVDCCGQGSLCHEQAISACAFPRWSHSLVNCHIASGRLDNSGVFFHNQPPPLHVNITKIL